MSDVDEALRYANGEKDCAVCLQKCHHPTQLPCGHIFCFLCVKGVAIQSRKCAMCRAAIPADYLDHPVLLQKLSLNTSPEDSTVEYQWYYEGRNGWWKYDERSNEELEACWNNEETQCSLLLAGAVYLIDFASMVQTRRNDTTRRRKVRRDAPTLPAKGIAGIKIVDESGNETKTDNDNAGSSPSSPQTENPEDEGESTSSPQTENPEDEGESTSSPQTENPEDEGESTAVTENISDNVDPDENHNEISVVIGDFNSLSLGEPSQEDEET